MSNIYHLSRATKLEDFRSVIDISTRDYDISIHSVASSNAATSGCLTFANNSSALVNGAIVIATKDCEATNLQNCVHIPSNNPRLTFVRILTYLKSKIGFNLYNESAIVDPSAEIGANVVIQNGCIIGANVVIEPNVVIHSGTVIGDNSFIRSGASIGSDGFGFERLEDGTPIRFPHLGRVVLGENVEIGSNTTVARGTLGDTRIDDYAKIDNLVHVAHNVHIKRGAFVTACAELSGGVVVGKNAWIAPNVSTHQKIEIGENSIVGVGAAVVKNVPENTVFAGNPARKLRDIS